MKRYNINDSMLMNILLIGFVGIIILLTVENAEHRIRYEIQDLQDEIRDLERDIMGLYPDYETKEVDCSKVYCLNINASDNHTLRSLGGLNINREIYQINYSNLNLTYVYYTNHSLNNYPFPD